MSEPSASYWSGSSSGFFGGAGQRMVKLNPLNGR